MKFLFIPKGYLHFAFYTLHFAFRRVGVAHTVRRYGRVIPSALKD